MPESVLHTNLPGQTLGPMAASPGMVAGTHMSVPPAAVYQNYDTFFGHTQIRRRLFELQAAAFRRSAKFKSHNPQLAVAVIASTLQQPW